MNYNQYKLSKTEFKTFKKETELFESNLYDIVEVLKEILILHDEKKLENYFKYQLTIIERFRLNLGFVRESILLFNKDFRNKLSINLIMRCVASDIITLFYLQCFYVDGHAKTETLKNELNVFSREYLLFLVDYKDNPYINNWLEEIKEIEPELFKDNGKIKSKKELRESSNEEIKELFNNLDTNKGKFLSEKQKLNFIKEFWKDATDFDELYMIFKYFSQYQHYNLNSKNMISNDYKLDLNLYDRLLGFLLIVIETALKFSNQDTSNIIKLLQKFKIN